MGRSSAQGVLLKYLKRFKISEVNSELEQARGSNLGQYNNNYIINCPFKCPTVLIPTASKFRFF